MQSLVTVAVICVVALVGSWWPTKTAKRRKEESSGIYFPMVVVAYPFFAASSEGGTWNANCCVRHLPVGHRRRHPRCSGGLPHPRVPPDPTRDGGETSKGARARSIHERGGGGGVGPSVRPSDFLSFSPSSSSSSLYPILFHSFSLAFYLIAYLLLPFSSSTPSALSSSLLS